ncbi:hypothetical protein AAF712_013548 [Marasmius tenuissimus]|uniref:Uncharacterized protein n=1 Tax=Marasmius tenuissimus TaxID=585030 RepID=A0ABR2ZEG9_9AGAR
MSSVARSFHISNDSPDIISAPGGETINLNDYWIFCPGRALGTLVNELGVVFNSLNVRHHFDRVAILRFLDFRFDARAFYSVHDDQPYQLPPDLQGLKTEHMHIRWARMDPYLTPRELGGVPVFMTHDDLQDHSLSFGAAILFQGEPFDRAVLLGVVYHHSPDLVYIVCQTNRQHVVVYIIVPRRALATYFPSIHSATFQLIAEISPDIAGLSTAGNAVVRDRLARVHPPTPRIRHAPLMDLRSHLGPEAQGQTAPTSSFPSLSGPDGLGAWVINHGIPRGGSPDPTTPSRSRSVTPSSAFSLLDEQVPPSYASLMQPPARLSLSSATALDPIVETTTVLRDDEEMCPGDYSRNAECGLRETNGVHQCLRRPSTHSLRTIDIFSPPSSRETMTRYIVPSQELSHVHSRRTLANVGRNITKLFSGIKRTVTARKFNGDRE